MYNEIKLEEYKAEDIKKLLEINEKLVIVNANNDEVIIKYSDIPDVIIDLNNKIGSIDLEIYDYTNPSMEPMLTTYGCFLNKCNQEVRKDIIDRLVQLQTDDDHIKPYKVIDIDLIDEIKNELDDNNEMER